MFDLKIKVLVVDDMLTMRKIVSKTLRDIGFQDITEAVDGNDAWSKVQEQEFGLIISDWNMPNCTGLDFLKRVRASSKLSKTPFILVTAEAEAHQVGEAVKSGVDQYVVKPFSKDSLIEKISMTYKRVTAKNKAA